MRKILSMAAACVIACGTLSMPVFAQDYARDPAKESAKVTVTISDGKLVLACAEVSVRDIDGDDVLTINDALFTAHEQYFDAPVEGYASTQTDYGLSMSMLWGIENGGSYGYYVNNASAWSLTDPIKEGDHIVAFVYTDLTNYSDAYCFFDSSSMTVNESEIVELTLKQIAFDENWNPVEKPVEGAKIVVDGAETTAMTDADGKALLSFTKAGTYTVSAECSDMVIVPPACVVRVNSLAADHDKDADDDKTSPDTGASDTAVFAGAALLAIGAIAVLKRRK